ncbi:MAG: hypothetical protein M3126_02400 [Candidatus Eremiobacteraeota bacterium]|nr:hypothetical protein [Candidatus Eremiobacteraeota bacterium]
MKFFAGLLSLVGLSICLCGSAAASKTHAVPAKHAKAALKAAPAQKAAPARKITVAAADEYFGHLKMSILGIRNTLKDLAQKADYNPNNPEQIFGSAAFAEEALHEWEHKYPGDPWLAKTVAGVVHMYARVPTAGGRAKMHAAFAWLQARYGKTKALVEVAKAEVASADKAVIEAAAAATIPPAASAPNASAVPALAPNAPAPAVSNAPAPPHS